MKKIGDTNDGNILIELSKSEYLAFLDLARASKGEMPDYTSFRHDWIRDTGALPDYSGIFGAITAFIEANYRLNELQSMIDRARLALFDGAIEDENSDTE